MGLSSKDLFIFGIDGRHNHAVDGFGEKRRVRLVAVAHDPANPRFAPEYLTSQGSFPMLRRARSSANTFASVNLLAATSVLSMSVIASLVDAVLDFPSKTAV